MDEFEKTTQRWHFTHNGRTFIIYDHDSEKAYTRACQFVGEKVSLIPSGWYDRKTNTIVVPQDGPHFIIDERKSGM